MTSEEALSILNKIIDDYNILPEPKYRSADIDILIRDYELLTEIKAYQKGNKQYHNIVNAITQIIHKMTPKDSEDKAWRNVSDRGINKAIPPVVKKKNHPIEFPFQWIDDKSQITCYCNGYWSAKNYMLMDILGYRLLLKEGNNCLPKKSAPIFNDPESIATRELALSGNGNIPPSSQLMTSEQVIQRIQGARYYIQFTDEDFQKHIFQDMSPNTICNLLLETSRVEFKLVFPVRMRNGAKNEQRYRMNFFSRLFEFGYIEETRENGIIQPREYLILFNTVLGEMFAHNLLSKSYDWLDYQFYNLPHNAQIFYRRFVLNNNYKNIPIKIETIKEALKLEDKNITNLRNTIERNILAPLVLQGLIDPFEKEDGLHGLKFIIKRSNTKVIDKSKS